MQENNKITLILVKKIREKRYDFFDRMKMMKKPSIL